VQRLLFERGNLYSLKYNLSCFISGSEKFTPGNKYYWIFELNSTSMSVADFELVTKSFAALPGGVAG
jgi:hypothetical protein